MGDARHRRSLEIGWDGVIRYECMTDDGTIEKYLCGIRTLLR